LETLRKQKIQNRIPTLLKSIASTPETGIGKPEKLKVELSDFWSGRINKVKIFLLL
jgi:toxin YoeB